MATFNDFSLISSPNSGDYVVGYNSSASQEQRYTVNNLFKSQGLTKINENSVSVNPAENFNYLSGQTSISLSANRILLNTYGNIVGVGIEPYQNYIDPAESSTVGAFGNSLLGVANSAFKATLGLFNTNSCMFNNIHGYDNVIQGGANVVGGAYNFINADCSNVNGVANFVCMPYSNAEGIGNVISRPSTISRVELSANKIFFAADISSVGTQGLAFRSGSKFYISTNFTGSNMSPSGILYTVLSADSGEDSLTTVESLTTFTTVDILSGTFNGNFILPTGYRPSGSGINAQVGAHAEGINNFALTRGAHVEGINNFNNGIASHVEGHGNFANTNLSHIRNSSNKTGTIIYWTFYDAEQNKFYVENNTSTLSSNRAPYDGDLNALSGFTATVADYNGISTTSSRVVYTQFKILSADNIEKSITPIRSVYNTNKGDFGSYSPLRFISIFSSSSNQTVGGYQSIAAGTNSFAQGLGVYALGYNSIAMGVKARADHQNSYIWSDGDGSTTVSTGEFFKTTKPNQYVIDASGGTYIPNTLGIGTDSTDNALTVIGNISSNGTIFVNTLCASNITNTIIPENLILNSLSATSVTTLYNQAPFVGNYWPLDNPRNTSLVGNNLSASVYKAGRYSMYNIIPWLDKPTLIIEETSNNKFVQGDVVSVCGYHREGYIAGKTENNPLRIFYKPFGGTASFIYSLTGSSSYDKGYVFLTHTGTTFLTATDQNLSIMAGQVRIEKGQPQDPGTPFSTLGRGRFVHGLNLEAGDPKFTNGSDHFHLIQTAQSAPGWQKINGGSNQYPQILTEHTLAFRANFASTAIVAANTSTLLASSSAPYGVLVPGINYASLWLSSNLGSGLNVGKIIYFSVSNTGDTLTSLRKIGFTAATYPAKIVHSGAIGTAQSNADIPTGNVLPANAAWHIRVEPYNLSPDNWNNSGGAFNGLINNSGEVVRTPSDPLIAPNTVSSSVSAIGGYDTVSVENDCEVVLNFTTNPLTSASQKFLYEGLPVILLVSDTATLSADNYSNNLATKTGYGINTSNNEFTGNKGSYNQTVYDGYIYRTTANKVIVRVGINRGLEESRLGTHEAPNFSWFRERPWPITVGSTNLKTLTLTLTTNYSNGTTIPIPELNGQRLLMSPGYPNDGGMVRYGLWSGRDNFLYTVPKTLKSQLELHNFSALSSSNKEIYIYSGNKDPVHRPVPGMQTWFFERYPTYQPDLKETGGVVRRFAIGPSCEGLQKDTGVVGFGSTCYHEKSMAIGHKAETTENNQVVIAADNSIMRLGNTSLLALLSGSTNVFKVERDGSLEVTNTALSTNGINTYLKLKSGAITYGLKLDVIG